MEQARLKGGDAVISRDRLSVCMTTTGSATAGFEELRKNYVYGGSKPLGDTPPEVTAGGAARTARREKRIDEFAEALAALGEPDPWRATRAAVIKAGEQVGVQRKTAMGYRTALRQRQAEGTP